MNAEIRNSGLKLGDFKGLCPMCGRETIMFETMTGWTHCKTCHQRFKIKRRSE